MCLSFSLEISDVTYWQDADGDRSRVGYPSGQTVDYTFDFAGRPLTATGTLGGQTIYYVIGATYRPFGPLATLNYGNGTVRTMSYDTRYLPQSLTLALGGTTRLSLSYGDDANGNITAITDNLRGPADRMFGYDDLNRLTTANASSLWGSGSYTYDDGGNMLTLSLGTKTKSFEYSGVTSKLAAMTENGVRRTVGYDAAGNQTTYYNTNTYSPRNQLTGVANGRNALYMFKYHAGGVRTIAEWNWQWEPQTYFYTPEMNLLSYTKQRMPGISRPDMDEDIIWFAGMPVAQKFIAVNNGATRWTCPDHLGTPVMQTDGNGAVVWQPQYEPYGQVWTMTTGARTDQILRFPGQEDSYDENGNAVYYNIFRWYGAGWGRYTQADPALWMWSIMPKPYSYASEAPLRRSDRLGLFDIDKSCSNRPFNGVAGDVANMCSRTTTPGTECNTALGNASLLLGKDEDYLTKCFAKQCSEKLTKIYCGGCEPNCAATRGGFPQSELRLGIGVGSPACPKEKLGSYEESLFHETLHVCEFGDRRTDEPDLPGGRGALFRYLEKKCYGWRDANAPPLP